MGSVDIVHADFTHLFVVFYAQMLIKSQLESSFKTYFNVLETRQLFHLVHFDWVEVCAMQFFLQFHNLFLNELREQNEQLIENAVLALWQQM